MTTRHSKKRKYFRKCGFCGSRHEQSDMVRTGRSPNGWICRECLEDDEEPDLDGLVTMIELEPCPFCHYKNRLIKVHIISRRLPFWWYIKCDNCHFCGETKLFLRRAIVAWNRRTDDET